MGYYTKHSLEIIGNVNYENDYQEKISELSGYSNCFDEKIKWYGHEQDMRMFSKKHPELIFVLSGEGEESGDMWKEYYKNGKVQKSKAQIIFSEYDENKLE